MSYLLLSCAIKSTVLLACAALAAALLRRSSAAVRHSIWLAAMASLLLLPIVSELAPMWRTVPVTLKAVTATQRVIVDVVASRGGWDIQWPVLFGAIWALGWLLATARIISAWRRVHAVARRAADFLNEDGTPVRTSHEISVPMVIGLVRPMVLLPQEARTWPEERLRLVLRHELTHVDRRDTVTQAVAHLVCAAYWFQPLVWWATARLRHECEEACDDRVLSRGEKATVYAGHLIEIVRGIGARERLSEGGIAMARRTELEQRLKAMLTPNRDRSGVGRRVAALVAVASVVVLLPVAALRAPAQDVGTIAGVVRDASGAVVPHARVILKWVASDRKEFTMTNDAGEYSFRPIPVGEYVVNVAKQGFVQFDSTKFSITGVSPFRADVGLNIGGVKESIDVTAEGASNVSPGPAAGPGTAPTRIRVGGNVMASKLVYKAKPSYPPACKQERVEGTVMFRGIVGMDGSLLNLEQVNQLVDPRLVEAAREAVKTWRYEPTLLNGNPVEVVTEIQVNFTLAR